MSHICCTTGENLRYVVYFQGCGRDSSLLLFARISMDEFNTQERCHRPYTSLVSTRDTRVKMLNYDLNWFSVSGEFL